MDTWLVTGGLPDEPDTGSWDEVCNMPGPSSFLEALFTALCQVSVAKHTCTITDISVTEDGGEEVSQGTCGAKHAGLRFKETRNLESSMFPMHCEWESFGLPGVSLRWTFGLEKAGQLGYVAFRNGSLLVTFQDKDGQQCFEETWQKTFSRKPVLKRAVSSQ